MEDLHYMAKFPLFAIVILFIVFLYVCVCVLRSRHLMLLMGSKLDVQIPQAHWGSSLIMVIFTRLFFIMLTCLLLMKIFSTFFAGCDALACTVCLF